MTTHKGNEKAIQQGQQGGPAQKNQAAQGGFGAESHQGGGVLPDSQQQQGGGGEPPRQQDQQNTNPGQTGTPGGKGKQDAP